MEDQSKLIEKLGRILETYTPSPEAIELVQKTSIILLVGIAGAGKDTIKHHLLETDKYHHIVSHTTRSPRTNNGVMEQDGVEYHFVSREDMLIMIERGDFIEAKMYSNNIYGTSVDEIRAAHNTHRTAITDIEVQGVAEYKALSNKVFAVFILPPSYEVWMHRLLSRYNGQPEPSDLRRRMETAVDELEHALGSDYFTFIINDDLETTVKDIDKHTESDSATDGENEPKALARELLFAIKAKL